MPDVFISYSTSDEKFARFLQKHLQSEGVDAFLAAAAVSPGQQWSKVILSALSSSSWVVFLASRAACTSPWVQQELGGALIAQKKLVPIVWDMSPSELPGWTQHFQALDLAGATLEDAKAHMSSIASRIKSDKAQGLLIAGLAVAALFALGSR
jgi:TIR domain